jgi:LacI family transcriptional regulator
VGDQRGADKRLRRVGVRQLLERFPDLDGVLAYNDIMAIGAMRELEDVGRRVPDDVAVIGVDDIALSALSDRR